ncbi:hypothetical protein [Falsiroseomonas sp. CW058]|uniref:hypothetical protein n=1 Tax=Falsiroseomonas sp. CW058 TaxID=3388664 RepID=UPI003D3165BB
MGKVWVYNWNHVRGGEGAAWGHSAIQVEGGAYISWWPESENRQYMVDKSKNPKLAAFLGKVIGTTNIYKVRHRCHTSYLQDVQAEGRQADMVCEIANGVLNTDAIGRWWTGYAVEKASYHSIKKNCSTTVIRALRAGGSDSHLTVKNLGTKAQFLPTVDFFSKRTGWEPTDIVAYLRLLNRALGDAKVNLNGAPATTPPPRNLPVQGSGVAMCEEHGFPLMTCPNC